MSKTARRSFSKDPYVCLKPWSDDCFVQCGGNGVVFQSGGIEEALENPEEAIKTVLGEPSKQKHYRIAFFEAFPKDPKCFIRGEGKTIEEAEERAYSQFLKIQACEHKEFDRRGREDGYAYCKSCPYSSTVLEPLTKCTVCQVPSHYSTDLKKQWYCQDHYFELNVEDICSQEKVSRWFYDSPEEQRRSFLQGRAKYLALKEKGYKPGTEKYEQVSDYLIQYMVWVVENNRVTKTIPEAQLEILLQMSPTIKVYIDEIVKRFPELIPDL